MRIIIVLLTFIFLLINGNTAIAHEALSTWKTSRESEQIQFSYRYLNIGDTLKTRQMRITFMVEAEITQLVPMFRNTENLKRWTLRAEHCELIEQNQENWTIYSLFDIPWPFQQKDLITEYRLVKKDSSVELFLIGRPSKLPQVKEVSRMGYFEGYWSFTTHENGCLKAEFTSITFQKPQFPKFIQDPIIQNAFIDSIKHLKQLIKEQNLSNEWAYGACKMEESK